MPDERISARAWLIAGRVFGPVIEVAGEVERGVLGEIDPNHHWSGNWSVLPRAHRVWFAALVQLVLEEVDLPTGAAHLAETIAQRVAALLAESPPGARWVVEPAWHVYRYPVYEGGDYMTWLMGVTDVGRGYQRCQECGGAPSASWHIPGDPFSGRAVVDDEDR